MKNNAIRPTFEPFSEDLSFSHKKTTQNASYAYHRHDGCEVYLFLSGDVKLYVEQTCFVPVPGSLVVIAPTEMHRVQMVGNAPYDRIVIYYKQSYLDALSAQGTNLSKCFYDRPVGTQNLRVLSPAALKEFLKLYEGLSYSDVPDCYGAPILRNAYASLLLLFINRQFQNIPSSFQNQMPPYIMETMQYVEAHFDESLNLSLLASHCHVSESYLSKQFKLHTGLTLRAYLLDRKINHAKNLLLQGSSVTEACYLSGFNDYANFLRSFKSQTGISPGKYAGSLTNAGKT